MEPKTTSRTSRRTAPVPELLCFDALAEYAVQALACDDSIALPKTCRRLIAAAAFNEPLTIEAANTVFVLATEVLEAWKTSHQSRHAA